MGKNQLNVTLIENKLTADKTDYTGIVVSNGTLSIDEVIKEMQKDGMDIRPETAKAIISRYNNKCMDLVMNGYHVNSGLCIMHTTVKGVFHGETWNTEKNSVHVAFAQTAETQHAIAETTIAFVGEHHDHFAIFSVKDLKTGLTDGTASLGFVLQIKGVNIKIVGDDPTCGVYLSSAAGDVKLAPENIVHNDPKSIEAILSSGLVAGTYNLRITTQFSGSAKPLKAPRTAVYPGIIIIV
jgi:hypothetical protein